MSAPELIDVYAACVTCGASIPDWQRRMLPLCHARVVLTARRELGVRAPLRTACNVCGGSLGEIRVEDRSPIHVAAMEYARSGTSS
jgi:hypothetical protein